MPIEEFPLNPNQCVGQFWIADDDDAHSVSARRSAGVSRVEGDRIDIELSDPLTPWHEPDPDHPGGWIPVENDPTDLVIHAETAHRPNRLTFWAVFTRARRGTPVFDMLGRGPEYQHLQAEWCLAGDHLGGPKTTFTGVRARFSLLEAWALSDGLLGQMTWEPIMSNTFTYTAPKIVDVAFTEFDQKAKLSLVAGANIDMPTFLGAGIRLYDWLELSDLSGWTLEECLARFVRPTRTLLELLAGERCRITHLEVRRGQDQRWIKVYGHDITPAHTRSSDTTMLLTRDKLTLEHLGRWCGRTATLSPAPYVVAAATTGEFHTVETEALALATTAEGLHRKLHPERQLSTEEIKAAKISLKACETIPPDIRARLDGALSSFGEPSYAGRLEQLAREVSEAVPECVGEVAEWKREVRNLRNGGAHARSSSKANADTNDVIFQQYSLSQSLKWCLLIRLLQDAGLSDETLQQAVSRNDKFVRDERHWRERWPKIYATAKEDTAQPNVSDREPT